MELTNHSAEHKALWTIHCTKILSTSSKICHLQHSWESFSRKTGDSVNDLLNKLKNRPPSVPRFRRDVLEFRDVVTQFSHQLAQQSRNFLTICLILYQNNARLQRRSWALNYVVHESSGTVSYESTIYDTIITHHHCTKLGLFQSFIIKNKKHN